MMRKVESLINKLPDTELRQYIMPLVIEAAKIALEQWDDSPKAILKADGSPVTKTDFAVERFLHDKILEIYPSDGFVGEEESNTSSNNGKNWVVDPIDGTQQFIRGQEFWSTLIALNDGDRGKLGILSFPARSEVIHSEQGQGSWEISPRGVKQLKVSSVRSMSDAYLLHNGIAFAQFARRSIGLGRLAAMVRAERGYADAFGHAEVIRGRSDIMVDFLTEYHDIAAVRVAVAEAGGMWSSMSGGQTLDGNPHGSVTSNGILHNAVLNYLDAQD